ncbi:MAG: hypothetical protein HC809_16960 [Gammaproteobacteria bacterium]|nr:hypothetical protein [Gammaproteobacteria bacterium]
MQPAPIITRDDEDEFGVSAMDPRQGEKVPTKLVRSGRFIESQDGWYFRTREGIAVGPYPTEFDAQVCASLLTARLKQADPKSDQSGVIQEFLSDPSAGPRSAQFRRVTPVEWRHLRKTPTALDRLSSIVSHARAMLSPRGH